MAGDPGFRIEHDSMGEVRVPADALWGAQTQRAAANLPVSGLRIDRGLIAALGQIKAAAATVNAEFGLLDADMAAAIAAAAAEVAEGAHDAHFPVDVFQTGSGTSSNMNANEVIAAIAARASAARSTRTITSTPHSPPTTCSPPRSTSRSRGASQEALLPALGHLAKALEAKAAEFADVVKAGRTHLMDATPVTLGQEFGGYAAAVRRGAERISAVLPQVGELPLGGTAVGTGLGAPPGFAAKVIAMLAGRLDLPLTEARDHFEAAGGRDALVAASGTLRVVAISLYKIANDLRLMASGPRAGLAEISLPDLQPGSSIMPGKVNPVVCEAVCQVAAQVIGNDATVAFCGTAGNFELNVMMPVLARNLLESVRLLAGVAPLLADRCVAGIQAHLERLRRYAESSVSIVTALNRFIGYEAGAEVAKQALQTGSTIREVVIERGHVESGEISLEQLDAALDVLTMTRTPQGPGG